MINYLLTSTFIHAAILLSLVYSPKVNTSGATQTEVTLIQKGESAPILQPLGKPLIPGQSGVKVKKVQKVDMTDYANQLKMVVDPVWVSKLEPYQSKLTKTYEIIILLSVDNYGRITSMRVKKSSGDSNLDALAVETFKEIGSIPKPPESVVKDGIEWALLF
jgi:TonB family protein